MPDGVQDVAAPVVSREVPSAEDPKVMAAAVAPAEPGPAAPSRSFMQSLGHAVTAGLLGTLAGGNRQTVGYKADESGQLVPEVREITTGEKIAKIARSALSGLAAGSREPRRASGIATALAGVGAGAEQVRGELKAGDIAKRQQATEEFERQQKTTLQKHSIAMGNALAFHNWQTAMQEGLEHDPERQSNLALAKAAEAAGIPVRYISADEAEQMAKTDPDLVATHAVRPVGFRPIMTTDAEGNATPAFDEQGKPKFTGQLALISGLHDGNISLPESVVAEAKKYAPLGGRVQNVEALQTGHTMSVAEFLSLETEIQEGKKIWLSGELNPTLVWTGPNKDVPVLINPRDGQPVKAMKDVVPQAAKEAEAKIGLQKAQTAEAYAAAKEKLANAATMARMAGDPNMPTTPELQDAIAALPPATKAILSKYSPPLQSALLTVANGDADVKIASNRLKGVMNQLQLTGLARLINPDWNEQLYTAKQTLQKDFTGSGKDAQQIGSFNTFFGHAGQAYRTIERFKQTGSPLADKSINWLRKEMAGDPEVSRLITDLGAPMREYFTFLNNNFALQEDDRKQMQFLLDQNSAVGQKQAVLDSMSTQAITRLDAVNERWRRLYHQNFPGLISDEGMAGIQQLGLEGHVQKYAVTGRRPTGFGVAGTAPVRQFATNPDNKHRIYTDDGGKTWLDAQTNQPLSAPTPPTVPGEEAAPPPATPPPPQR